jgi:hypothetical protein
MKSFNKVEKLEIFIADSCVKIFDEEIRKTIEKKGAVKEQEKKVLTILDY